MLKTFTTKAIVLDRQDYRENDLRVVVYSKDKGKLELVAKGAKKNTSKVASHIEPLNLVSVMIVIGKQFDYIGGAVSNNCFSGIKSNFEKVEVSCGLVRILSKLIKKEYKDEKIFYLLKDFLVCLDKKSTIDILDISFKLKFIAALGYSPVLYYCVHCNKKTLPNNNKFSFDMCGVVCLKDAAYSKNCLKISDNCIKLLRTIIKLNFTEIVNLKVEDRLLKEGGRVVNSFLQYILNS